MFAVLPGPALQRIREPALHHFLGNLFMFLATEARPDEREEDDQN
jgi:hypothetical protein